MTKPEKQLPNGWQWAKLSEICHVFAGSSAPQGKEYFDPSGPFFFRVSDLGKYGRNANLVESQDRLSHLALENCQLVLARKGTIIFPKSGAAITTNNRAMLGVEGYIVSHLMGIEPQESILLSDWLYYVICQIDMMDYSDNTGYPSLKKSNVEKIEIPLPPLSEQKRIVKILNEQMAAIEKARKAVCDYFDTTNILSSAYLRNIFSQDNLKRWPKKQFGDISQITAKQVNPTLPEYRDLPHVNGENIESGTGRLTYLNTAAEELMISGKYLFPKGSVLYSKLRPYLRKVALVDFDGVCSADMYPIQVDSKYLRPDFVAWLLLSDEFTNYAVSESQRARMPKLNRKQLFSWEAPVPPLDEQKEMINKLMLQMERATILNQKVEELVNTIEALPSALLRKAFRGEL